MTELIYFVGCENAELQNLYVQELYKLYGLPPVEYTSPGARHYLYYIDPVTERIAYSSSVYSILVKYGKQLKLPILPLPKIPYE